MNMSMYMSILSMTRQLTNLLILCLYDTTTFSLSMGYTPLLFAALAYFTPELDLAISNYFYDSNSGIFPGGKVYSAIRFWTVIPAMFIAVAASIFLGLSYFISRWKIWRAYALLLILPMALGPGLSRIPF